jgi:hypothetical protein
MIFLVTDSDVSEELLRRDGYAGGQYTGRSEFELQAGRDLT